MTYIGLRTRIGRHLSGVGRRGRAMLGDMRGSTTTLVALSLPVVIGAAGIGVETSMWYTVKTKAQMAADAAAIGAARTLSGGDTSTVATTVGTNDATRNGYTNGVGGATVAINIPPTSGANVATTAAAEVIVTVSVTGMFSQFMTGVATRTITARSVAAENTSIPPGGGSGCFLALHPSAASAIAMSGSGTIAVNGCFIAANSTSASGMRMTGSGLISAASGFFRGGYANTGSGSIVFTTPAETNRTTDVADPYAGQFATIALPSLCTYSTTYSWGSSSTSPVLVPGRYCGGINLTGSGTLRLSAGTYYMDGGSFSIGGSGNVECTDCTGTAGITIVLTTSGAVSTIGNLSLTGGGNIDLPAPLTGSGQPYVGIAILQDPRASTSGTGVTVSGGGIVRISGAIYASTRAVSLNGGADATSGRRCMTVIARTISLNGSGTIQTTDCAAMGTTVPTASTKKVRHVE